MKDKKIGQSSLEYGAFFAFALMVGLMIIIVIGEFSLYGSESDIRKGRVYWYSKKPISIEDMVYYDDGMVIIALRNKDIQPIYVENLSSDEGYIKIQESFASGEAKVFNNTGFPLCNATELELVKLSNISFSYKRPGTSEYLVETGKERYYTNCIKSPFSNSSDGGSGGGSGGGCASPFIYFLLIIPYLAFNRGKNKKTGEFL